MNQQEELQHPMQQQQQQQHHQRHHHHLQQQHQQQQQQQTNMNHQQQQEQKYQHQLLQAAAVANWPHQQQVSMVMNHQSAAGAATAGANNIGSNNNNNNTNSNHYRHHHNHHHQMPANGKKTKGRVRINMEFIQNKLRRYTTFSKRKSGIMKKARELATLTGTQVMLLVASETGHVYTYATEKFQPVITSDLYKTLIVKCLDLPNGANLVMSDASSSSNIQPPTASTTTIHNNNATISSNNNNIIDIKHQLQHQNQHTNSSTSLMSMSNIDGGILWGSPSPSSSSGSIMSGISPCSVTLQASVTADSPTPPTTITTTNIGNNTNVLGPILQASMNHEPTPANTIPATTTSTTTTSTTTTTNTIGDPLTTTTKLQMANQVLPLHHQDSPASTLTTATTTITRAASTTTTIPMTTAQCTSSPSTNTTSTCTTTNNNNKNNNNSNPSSSTAANLTATCVASSSNKATATPTLSSSTSSSTSAAAAAAQPSTTTARATAQSTSSSMSTTTSTSNSAGNNVAAAAASSSSSSASRSSSSNLSNDLSFNMSDDLNDRLIFSDEYLKALNESFHMDHFLCRHCYSNLSDQRYVLKDEKAYCIQCYETNFANICEDCQKPIGIDWLDLSYKDRHWHDTCFLCNKCQTSLIDQPFGLKSNKVYCADCYDDTFASRCDGCKNPLRTGSKKTEYRGRQWHDSCFCCCICLNIIDLNSFISKNEELYCIKCYDNKFATKCTKCKQTIVSDGVTFRNEAWHRECFNCCHCNKSLAGQRFTTHDVKNGTVDSTNKTNQPHNAYCVECYGELFAKKCFTCTLPITGLGGARFVIFEDRTWHNDCFNCNYCQSTLVGKGFITDGPEAIICSDCARAKLTRKHPMLY